MNRVCAVAWRDLKRAAMAPLGIGLMLSVPLILAGIMGLSFGSSSQPGKIPRLRLLVWDRDGSLVSRFITSALGQERTADFVDAAFVRDEGMEMLREGKASALLIIPPGFADSILSGSKATLQLVKNPAERFMPVIAHHAAGALATVLDALILVLEDDIRATGDPFPSDGLSGEARVGGMAERISRKIYHLSESLTPWPLHVDSVREQSAGRSIGVFGAVLPGLTVLMLMMIGQKLLREVSEEHENGMLSALLASPLNPIEYGAGKTLALLVIIGAGFLILMPAGALLFGINWGNPVGVMMVAGSFAVATAGIMMLLVGISRTGRQADALGVMVVLIMGLVGGSMIPFRAERGPLAILAGLTPNRWAIDGFLTIMGGEGPAAVIRETAVLFFGGIVLMTAGGWALLRKVTR
ncbi:ABC transporter permease [Candidatus Fermentibacteria bacterium]|nr:ABC transporter permease [Candidatus Fermentibacteria bacterium]